MSATAITVSSSSLSGGELQLQFSTTGLTPVNTFTFQLNFNPPDRLDLSTLQAQVYPGWMVSSGNSLSPLRIAGMSSVALSSSTLLSLSIREKSPTDNYLKVTLEGTYSSLVDGAIKVHDIAPEVIRLGNIPPQQVSGTPAGDKLELWDFSETAYGMGGNDTMTGYEGDDHLDGGDGIDLAVWTQSHSLYELRWSSGQWSVRDKSGLDGTDTLVNMEKLVFSDKVVQVESSPHDRYDDLPVGLYQFFITAFGAAPGVTYMNQLAEAYRSGMSVKQIVDVFTTKKQFTDTYPKTLSHQQMATMLVGNIVKTSASSAAKDSAILDITAALNIGWTAGDVLYSVFGNLASKAAEDVLWGNTVRQFNHQIAVARTYTEIMDQSTTDLMTLRSAVAQVTELSDIVTLEAQVSLIGQSLLES